MFNSEHLNLVKDLNIICKVSVLFDDNMLYKNRT